jgi:hypothetical protein
VPGKGLAPTKEEGIKAREKYARIKVARTAAAELEAIAAKPVLGPGDDARARFLSDTIAKNMSRLQSDESLQEADMQRWSAIVPNPATWTQRNITGATSGTKARLAGVRQEIDNSERAQDMAYGFSAPQTSFR